ncbi:hypothetical protein D3C72_2181550 [compost metagenome]
MVWPNWPFWPLIDEMLITRPKPRSSIDSTTGLHTLNTESRLVLITASQSALPSLRKLASRVMPALLTSTSTGPSCSVMAATACWHESKALTSHWKAWKS